MKETTYNLSISELKEHFPASQRTGIGDDFCMIDINGNETIHSLKHPCRFDGIIMLYCVKGSLKISINLDQYAVTDNSLIVCASGNIIKVEDSPLDKNNLHYVLIAMSQNFAAELRIDFKRIINESMALIEAPVVTLPDDRKALVERYLELVVRVTEAEFDMKDNALRTLMSSMLCVVSGIWIEKMDEIRSRASQATTRGKMIFDQFIRLVSEYHTKYRNVGFYADKLCLTPKYLSKLIKTASGKSAPEWIDSFVILEAKNLLKYSDIAIKEIVYRLNFPNQSVFYKFFKARTGQTPSEYRNS